MFKKKSKTLEGILSSFQKTIDDLTVLQLDNDSMVAENEAAIQALKEQSESLAVESVKAVQVREKLLALIS